MLRVISRALFWTYQRGSWQYDLLCLVIILFIFLTPGYVFCQNNFFAASSMVKDVESVQVETAFERTPEQAPVSKSGPKDHHPVPTNHGTAP